MKCLYDFSLRGRWWILWWDTSWMNSRLYDLTTTPRLTPLTLPWTDPTSTTRYSNNFQSSIEYYRLLSSWSQTISPTAKLLHSNYWRKSISRMHPAWRKSPIPSTPKRNQGVLLVGTSREFSLVGKRLGIFFGQEFSLKGREFCPVWIFVGKLLAAAFVGNGYRPVAFASTAWPPYLTWIPISLLFHPQVPIYFKSVFVSGILWLAFASCSTWSFSIQLPIYFRFHT